jgi:DNA repair protein RecO (recombination protein O)
VGPKSAWKGLLQPFIPLLVRYVGKHDLKTLCDADSRGYPLYFSGIRLWCGLYINELLTRILHGHDPCPVIFDLYETTIHFLYNKEMKEAYILRRFEKELLKALGYDITMMLHISEDFVLDPAAHYHYLPEHGLSLVKSPRENDRSVFLGKDLLAIARDDFIEEDTLRAAKRLFRLAFSPLLGSKMLNSYKILL